MTTIIYGFICYPSQLEYTPVRLMIKHFILMLGMSDNDKRGRECEAVCRAGARLARKFKILDYNSILNPRVGR